MSQRWIAVVTTSDGVGTTCASDTNAGMFFATTCLYP